jgi:ceramide glucosyltransferase
MTLFLLIAGFVAFAYQAVALLASLHFKMRSVPAGHWQPGISILKPVRGLDEDFEAAIRTHALQEYPEFEILFGVRHETDPAVPAIRRLIAEFPNREIRLIIVKTDAPNGKIGTLIDLAREARHPVLLVNDSDISVPADYLSRVVRPLQDSKIGLVTCLYRAVASSTAGKWESLGIATDFIPSTLVAPLVGVREFGLGSTLCFRALDLERIGGFEAVADFIADDYQLSKRINGLGLRCHLSEVVVETHLSHPTWREVWQHQVRWARTIRVSRGDGYAGLPVTHAGVWALLCWLGGIPWLTALLLIVRIASGISAGFGVLHYSLVLKSAPLIPVWDLWAFAVWIAGCGGDVVHWRDKKMRLLPGGRMTPLI